MTNPTPLCPEGYTFKDCQCQPILPTPTCPSGYVLTGCECLPIVTNPVWTDLGVVSQIAVATTTWGKTISNLTPFAGEIFLGHGDYTMNVPNPCHLMAYDPATGYVDYGAINTVALLDTRVIGDQLAIPFTDPAVGSYPTTAFMKADGTMETLGAGYTPRAWHVFGAAMFNGKRYLSGSHMLTNTTDARAVWRDDAGKWVNTDFTPNSYMAGSGRVFALFVLGSALYAAPSGSIIKTTDGKVWSPVTTGPSRMRKPTVIGSYCYYLTGDAGSQYGLSALTRFDGSAKVTVATNIYDISPGTNGELYALTGDGRIVTVSGTTVHTTVPTGARSLCVVDGKVFVGTADSHVWSYA